MFIDMRIEEECYRLLTLERFIYENRSENVFMWMSESEPLYKRLLSIGWQFTGHKKQTGPELLNKIYKNYCSE